MDAETRAHLDNIKCLVEGINTKMDKRDLVLFGEDGRGGLVADVNAAKQRARILTWIVGGVIFPIIVGILVAL